MGKFWKSFAHVFAVIGKGALKSALWASDHPEVIAQVSDIAKTVGAPAGVVDKVGAKVNVVVDITNKVKPLLPQPPAESN